MVPQLSDDDTVELLRQTNGGTHEEDHEEVGLVTNGATFTKSKKRGRREWKVSTLRVDFET